MPLMPSERFTALRECHASDLTPLDQQCLAALALAYTNREAGMLLDMAPATFRRHISDPALRVFERTELPPGRGLLTSWFWLHIEDGTRPALALIRGDGLGRRRRR